MAETVRVLRRAVITGPTGCVGNALIRLLLQQGIETSAIIRPGSPRAAELPCSPLLRVVECDVSQLSTLPARLTSGADAFFHFAWAHTIGPGRNNMPAQISNIQYTIDACRAAAELGCQVFVGAGSQAEYGRSHSALTPDTPCFPENGYGIAKLCAGQMSRLECAHLGVDHIWPRILSIYGPHDGESTLISSVIDRLLAGQCPALTAGTQMWDYLYAEDAAKALLLMAQRGQNGAVYPLGSGTARPLREYVCLLRDAINPELPVGFGEIPYGPLQVMHLQADLTALSRDTGFCPETDFKTGISRTISWMRSHGRDE